MRHSIGGAVVIALVLATRAGRDALSDGRELQAVKQAVVRATGHSDVQVKLAGAAACRSR